MARSHLNDPTILEANSKKNGHKSRGARSFIAKCEAAGDAAYISHICQGDHISGYDTTQAVILTRIRPVHKICKFLQTCRE